MYIKTHDSIWKSLKRKQLSDTGKLLFIYLFSCPHRNTLGFYSLPYQYICNDLGWDLETVSKGFAELFQKGLCMYDEASEMVFVPGFLEHNPFDNPNVEKKAIALFEETHDLQKSALLRDFERVLKGLPIQYRIKKKKKKKK